MSNTITKKILIDRIAESTDMKRVAVKQVVQEFLDQVIVELGDGNRLEFREFGVFEIKLRAARKARNPRTGDDVPVPEKAVVHFKAGRHMKEMVQQALEAGRIVADPDGSGNVSPAPGAAPAPTPPARPAPGGADAAEDAPGLP